MVEKIYAFAGLPLSDTARDAMRRWEHEHAQHKYGAHKYRPEDFALTRETIAARCKPYIERFQQFF